MADVPSGLRLTPPQETKKTKTTTYCETIIRIPAGYLQGERPRNPLAAVYRYFKHLDTTFDRWNGWGRYKKVEGGSTLGFPPGGEWTSVLKWVS
jgi:hypothetical protein